jgi:hypothetical protein
MPYVFVIVEHIRLHPSDDFWLKEKGCVICIMNSSSIGVCYPSLALVVIREF